MKTERLDDPELNDPEIERWENEGGSCPHPWAEVVITSPSQQVSRLLTKPTASASSTHARTSSASTLSPERHWVKSLALRITRW